jgi:hypothetical protein
LETKIKIDAAARASEKAAGEKVRAVKEQAAAKELPLQPLLKELSAAVQALTKAHLAPRERKLIKGKDGSKTVIETPVGGG